MLRKYLLAAACFGLLIGLAACSGTSPATITDEVPQATVEQPEITVESTDIATEEPAPPVSGPDVPIGDLETVHIVTTAASVVGIGTYVAAEAYAVAAGEDVEAEPVQALILPYGITPDMQLETIGDFQQPDPAVIGFDFLWSLEVPEGSSAEVTGNPVALFLADVAGDYTLTLTATDRAGNIGSTTKTFHAATYIGNGSVTGENPVPPECAICHSDIIEAWEETGHATFFTRAINGSVSDHYSANCITCHTTGFNNRPEANNGGFDDRASAEGWTFPGTLQSGNWDSMIENFPEAAALANIQCESCHGPGSDHKGSGPISTGLAYGTCAQCHAEEPYHVYPQQWEISPHADKNAEAFWYPTGEDRLACVRCHTGGGYIDAANGVPQSEWRSEYQVITCAVCHDPHDAENPNQLRIFDTITLPNGREITDAGPAATCMTCHNTRVDPIGAVEGDTFSLPHYSSAAEMMTGGAGYTWGTALPNTPHEQLLENSCISCHMGPTPGIDDGGTPDDPGDDQPMAEHNTVGEHTFLIVSPVDGTENIGVCQQCHTGLSALDFQASGDHDGDGTIETHEAEIEGLVTLLQEELQSRGVQFLTAYPYASLPNGADVNLKGAVWNWKIGSDIVEFGGVQHNYKALVGLLQLSYEKLTGSPVPNADILTP